MRFIRKTDYNQDIQLFKHLIALGFVLIYKATEMVNFAQGDLMMLGAFFAYTYTSE